MPDRKHTGPSPSERTLYDLWDRIDLERSARGERAAVTLAKRAFDALNGEHMAGDPKAVIAMLQELRTDAENDGEMDAADQYGKAIKSVLQASGAAGAPSAEPTAGEPMTDAAKALQNRDLVKGQITRIYRKGGIR